MYILDKNSESREAGVERVVFQQIIDEFLDPSWDGQSLFQSSEKGFIWPNKEFTRYASYECLAKSFVHRADKDGALDVNEIFELEQNRYLFNPEAGKPDLAFTATPLKDQDSEPIVLFEDDVVSMAEWNHFKYKIKPCFDSNNFFFLNLKN